MFFAVVRTLTTVKNAYMIVSSGCKITLVDGSMRKIPGKYWMVWAAMCGMIGATLGVKNISGLFFTPMAESFGVGRGVVSLTLTINNLLLALGDFLSPKLFGGRNFKRLCCLCVGCVVGSTLLMSLTPGIWPLYLLSGVRGLASGMLGIVIGTVMINNWFIRYNSLVTGAVLAAGGAVSVVLSPVLSAVIERSGWRAGFCAEAVVALLLYAPLLLLPISFRPEDRGLSPLGGEQRTETSAAAAWTAGGRAGLLLPALLLYTAFANVASTFTNHLPGIADSYALSAAVGAAMLSASMASNAGGKVLMGALAERYGVKRPAIAYTAAIIGGLCLLLAARSAPAAVVSGALMGLAFSLTTVVPALVTKDIFGPEKYRTIFPFSTLIGTIANASAASLIGFLYDATGSYRSAILILIGLLCGIVVLLLLLYGSRGEKTQT